MTDEQSGGNVLSNEARIIGINLRHLRQSAALSQRQVGRLLGVSFQQIQKYERGENRIPVEKLHLLKNIYGVPYHYFFKGMPLHQDQKAAPFSWDLSVYERLSGLKSRVMKQKIEKMIEILIA